MPFLRAFAFVLALAATLVALLPVQTLARRRGSPLASRIQTGFCRLMCAIIGIEVFARDTLPGAAPRLIVANHVSWTDVLALASLHPVLFIAKSEVARWPALGLLARAQGTIFVARAARREVARVNDEVEKALRAGRDVVLFAEATSSDGAQVLRFNPPHFAAARCAAAVVPAAIAYSPADIGWYGDMSFVPHLWSLMQRKGVRCEIAFGAPLDAQDTGRKALAVATQEQVRALLERARRNAQAACFSGAPK